MWPKTPNSEKLQLLITDWLALQYRQNNISKFRKFEWLLAVLKFSTLKIFVFHVFRLKVFSAQYLYIIYNRRNQYRKFLLFCFGNTDEILKFFPVFQKKNLLSNI